MMRIMILALFGTLLAAMLQAGDNPLLAPWKTPFGAPPWPEIQPEHFLPAFDQAIAQHKAEIDRIVKNPAPPTFNNTLEPLDASGEMLSRVNGVFNTLTNAETTLALQELAKQVAPMMAAHADDMALNPGLFARVKAVYDSRESLTLTAEQKTLLTNTYRSFVRGGALLDEPGQGELRKINEELSLLSLQFGDNLLKVTNTYRLVLEKPEDLKGLPESVVATAAETAAKAGLPGKWMFTLQAPSVMPFLTYSEVRPLREQLYRAFTTRCDLGDERDNKTILVRIAGLRARKAKLLGFGNWADFTLDERMAKTPGRVITLLDQLWTPALAKAKSDAVELQAMIDASNGNFKLAAWDWRFCAEKRRKALFDLDDQTLRPYFALDNVRKGVFYLAGKLYGLTFTERTDIPVYHPEVKAVEVKEKDGRSIGLLYVDYHPRPGKRSGAWCDALRDQWIREGLNVQPIVINVGNFSRPVGDGPALLGLGEVETLFHEFGHALHILLSNCHYRSLSGANVAWDFVELPSQIMEHWVTEPEVLKVYARHHQTGEVIPDALIGRIKKAETFNQSYELVQLVAASRLDMDWHTLTSVDGVEADAFEKASLGRLGLIPEIPPMHRTPYFRHIFNGGYASGYYSYLWSAVLDCDAFQAFKDAGDIFDPKTAGSFRDNILSRGGTEEAMTLYLRFRGAEPKVDALLRKRGLN